MPLPLVAVLAGGRGSRLGEPKPLAELGGRPLIAWPLAAAEEAGLEAIVVAKAASALPDGLGVPVLIEPEWPRHPLSGLVFALERADGPVLAVGCDMPWITPGTLQRLASQSATAVYGDEPFPGRYEPAGLSVLRSALEAEMPVRAAVQRLEPVRLAPAGRETDSINTPEQLAAARASLG